MLKELLKNKNFFKIIKEFLKKPQILDIILFGSLARGKDEPRDIDLLVIYTGKEFEGYNLRKKLESINKNIELIFKRYDDVFNPEFFAREAILSEGYSLKKKKFISESLGYDNFILFIYSLKNFNKSKRMQFYYSLYGRGKQLGMLEKSKSHKFSDKIILCPVENSETIKSFLERLGIIYRESPILIPKRMIKHLVNKSK